ncbi:glycogen/starch/alpha-glucan phosphorylase [Falsibacillus pallidus]|uniref:glycogen/starch/alpha-glucan phosphorylase n=1 Tax=Falsibacillus pallidus TaxID=493781 RepID=UPI003D95B9F7
MFSDRDEFKLAFLKKLEMMSGKGFQETNSNDHFMALGNMVREHISMDWINSNEQYRISKNKQVYYLSIEFLLGKVLVQNLLNLGIYDVVKEGLYDLGISLDELEEMEPDAGLGNGGLGRLAACFMDSLASLQLPGHGCGIRYRHGLFEQKIVDGYQVELPEHWLKNGHVWEVRKNDLAVEIPFWGRVESHYRDGRLTFSHLDAEYVTAIPYDVPVAGYKNGTVNTLRLWSAEASPYPAGRDILKYKRETEAITEFLYPDDAHDEGKILRLKQQYFLVSASLSAIIKQYLERKGTMKEFADHVCIHINDTHPVLAIPELMRILIDRFSLSWDEAWDITSKTICYTNHTTLSEALEKWPVHLFKPLLPRIFMIVEEINERFCKELWEAYPGDWERIERMAILSHGQIKMAHLAIAGSFSVNGVAHLHTEILKEREMKDFHQFYPGKFNNKTNGITHRRWLLKANPELSRLISNGIGDQWIHHPDELERLNGFLHDGAFLQQLDMIKQKKKEQFAKRIWEKQQIAVDPASIFDVHIKRLHAYKRQLLNILHIMHLYNRIHDDRGFTFYPRTFIFGAKASPGYYYAKKIIKLIHTVADKISRDPVARDRIKIIFTENYRVSLAEEIIPAADISEQISTASKEASGTGNMKLMMNGAVTVGTMDGANVEIHEKVGSDGIFIFGLSAEEVLRYQQQGGYHSTEYYHHHEEIKRVVDQLVDGFLPDGAEEFLPIFDSLLDGNDQYFVLRDFASYASIQEKAGEVYQKRNEWLSISLKNIAYSGYFSSDRTIQQYAEEIWGIHSVPNLLAK